MSSKQAKIGLDVKKTSYALAIFVFFFGLSMAYLTFAAIINLQTFFFIMTLALALSIMISIKLSQIEKEQKKREKENSVALPRYQQGKTCIDVKKTGIALVISYVFFWNLMVYLAYIHVISGQTFFVLTYSAAAVWFIIGFKLRRIEKEQKKHEKENSIPNQRY